MISKACVIGAYQRKLEEIGQHRNVDLTVIVPPAWNENGQSIKLDRRFLKGYNLVVESMRFNGRYHLHFYWGIRRQISKIMPDIIHIDEEPYNLATFQSTWLGKRAGAKTVFFTWQNIHRRYPPPFRWVEQYILNHADAAIAGNHEAARVVRTKGYQGPVDIIPQFGVDPEIYKLSASATKIAKSPFVIGYAGRLVPEKGLAVLLRAVSGIKGDWQLKILGAGPQLNDLTRQAVRDQIDDRISFEAYVPSDQMPAFFSQLDAFVLPSQTQANWKEQFGRVLIEAMACEVPVIGSTCGEIPNVVGDAGLIFQEGNAHELRQCLERLMFQVTLRHNLAKAGRKRVLACYTQEHIAEQTVALYHKMMGALQYE